MGHQARQVDRQRPGGRSMFSSDRLRSPRSTSPTYVRYDAERILDLEDGKTTTITLSNDVNTPIWNRESQLLFPSSSDGSVETYDVKGELQGVLKNLGDFAASSADGSAVAFWFGSTQRPIHLVRNGGTQSFDLPGVLAPPDPQLSPDGSGLVVACVAGNNSTEVLLLAP